MDKQTLSQVPLEQEPYFLRALNDGNVDSWLHPESGWRLDAWEDLLPGALLALLRSAYYSSVKFKALRSRFGAAAQKWWDSTDELPEMLRVLGALPQISPIGTTILLRTLSQFARHHLPGQTKEGLETLDRLDAWLIDQKGPPPRLVESAKSARTWQPFNDFIATFLRATHTTDLTFWLAMEGQRLSRLVTFDHTIPEYLHPPLPPTTTTQERIAALCTALRTLVPQPEAAANEARKAFPPEP